MAQCEYCQKKPSMGNQIEHRGKAKYLGGVGRKITGITKRRFKPNLQKVRIEINGKKLRVRVAVSAIRSGLVAKRVKRKPFQMVNV